MQLHATQYGDSQNGRNKNGSPVIILHGLFGSSRNWHAIARALSDRHIVYALDLRNHGKSPHADTMDYPSMAQDVLDFIEQELQPTQMQPVNIIAHSMGGKVAMWLALSKPEIVQKLVVVDIAPVIYEHDFEEVLAGFQSIPLLSIKSRQDADGYLSDFIAQPVLRQFLLQNLQFKDGKYRWRLNLEAIIHSMSCIAGFPDTKEIEPFARRVLFIGGGQSAYLSQAKQKLTRQLFPLASFSMIKSAGHWLHAEQPELFTALVKPYLS